MSTYWICVRLEFRRVIYLSATAFPTASSLRFFFFQAEDGIRDIDVTGVQTCALPIFNQDWALRRGFKPCSTIKLVTGLAGLNEKVIDPVQTVNIGTGSFSLDLTDSLALSNNGYFQRVGGQVGFEKMMEYSRKLGLGQPTGINHPFESPGRLPVFKEGFGVNRMSSHGDDIEVTAVQLANMASAIANGGKLLVPHLPRTPEENVRFKRELRREIDIPQEHM